ncbi:hypothetical protein [Desertivirga arenae]|uniref:hypothetical protein n=1 Tax=Desertivirga arenae TaxID=2810309 RepID=UPI001A96BA26|nr:hypothetical protein [Pedobacter sp. SYSU D00823]
MNKKLFFSVIAGTIILSSCEKEDLSSLKQSPINTSFSSQVDEKVYLLSEAGSITFAITSISDNRCTAHDFCTDPGDCSVRIKVSNLDNSTAESILTIDNSSEHQTHEVHLKLGKKTYSVYLNNVNPKPFLKSLTTAKEAEFLVQEGK